MGAEWTWPNTELLGRVVQDYFRGKKISGEITLDSNSRNAQIMLNINFSNQEFLMLTFEKEAVGFVCEKGKKGIFCEGFLKEPLEMRVDEFTEPKTEEVATTKDLKYKIKERFKELRETTLYSIEYIILDNSFLEFLELKYINQDQRLKNSIEKISLIFPPFSLVGIAYCDKNEKIIIAEFPKIWKITCSYREYCGDTTIHLPATSQAEIRDLLKQAEIDPDFIKIIIYHPVSEIGRLPITRITEDEVTLRLPRRLWNAERIKELIGR